MSLTHSGVIDTVSNLEVMSSNIPFLYDIWKLYFCLLAISFNLYSGHLCKLLAGFQRQKQIFENVRLSFRF